MPNRTTPLTAPHDGRDPEPAVGSPGRIVVAASPRLPELAASPGTADRFDPATMDGIVEAYPTIIGRPYRMGLYTWHQLSAGAFDASLAEQGGRFPVYCQHNWDWSERAPIGHVLEAAEEAVAAAEDDARAVRIRAQLYPDVPDGLACLHALAAGALREWSIGYRILEYRVEEDEENARTIVHVDQAELWEASIVLRGANPWTETLEVAARPDAAGITEDRVRELVRAELAATQAPPAPTSEDRDPFADLDLAAIAASPSLRAAIRASR